jgi:hypothetical protein
VNLSLGTTNAEHAALLADALAYAESRGTRVVSAYEAHDARWLPGALAGAIGVIGDAEIDREAMDSLGDSPFGTSPVRASVYPRPIPGVPRERNLSGISFAVANASGFLARLLERHADPR